MIQRTCPVCGLKRYSADTFTDWTCERCGEKVGRELSVPVDVSTGKTEEVSIWDAMKRRKHGDIA